jgi:hypothetical protein
LLRKRAKTKGKQQFSESDPGAAPVVPFHSHGINMGQKFFLHKNKKAYYNIIDTCSCELSFPGKSAGLTRRELVYACGIARKVL